MLTDGMASPPAWTPGYNVQACRGGESAIAAEVFMNEAPRSKLRGILRNSLKPLLDPPSPRLRRVLIAFIPVASYGIFGERE
jgi:hypothetical protein